MNCLDVSVKFGSQDNLPDVNSVAATKCILDKINEATDKDKSDHVRSLFVVLLSGGGSACLTNPRGLSLDDKTELIRRLVQQGADIVELNSVRRCFSSVKGGNLARHILTRNPNAQVISLIMSDVINDPLDIISSGPTCLSASEGDLHEAMMRIVKKYDIKLPASGHFDCCQNADVDIDAVKNKIIGNNRLALEALQTRALQLGYSVSFMGNDLLGQTSDVVERMLDEADNLQAERSMIVGGGESTVHKGLNETWGVGGRVQEMALDYMLHKMSSQRPIKPESLESVDVFMAGSTDGQDGPTDVAACLASISEWSLERGFDVDDLARAKRTHDSYNFWSKYKPEWLVKTGSSGTYVMDLYMLINLRQSRQAKTWQDMSHMDFK